jgi:aspartyl-tRNA(Asn)/glutamyl-tRNA(Gln) amidotransferase subunit C
MANDKQQAAGQMDVRYVAHLARLDLTDAEAERFQAQLDHIVAYFNDLRAVAVEGVEPMAHAVPIQNVFRDDVPRAGLERETALANAPRQSADLFVVPKIVE